MNGAGTPDVRGDLEHNPRDPFRGNMPASAAGWRLGAYVTGDPLDPPTARPSFVQLLRQLRFEHAHPGAEFTPVPVGGLLLAWVPSGTGGVQFSGKTLKELLDAAEEHFAAAPDTG